MLCADTDSKEAGCNENASIMGKENLTNHNAKVCSGSSEFDEVSSLENRRSIVKSFPPTRSWVRTDVLAEEIITCAKLKPVKIRTSIWIQVWIFKNRQKCVVGRQRISLTSQCQNLSLVYLFQNVVQSKRFFNLLRHALHFVFVMMCRNL